MENINNIKLRVATMLLDKEMQKRKKRKAQKAELYMKDRMDGMTCVAIAKKYGVSHQAVSKACAKYRMRMEHDGEMYGSSNQRIIRRNEDGMFLYLYTERTT